MNRLIDSNILIPILERHANEVGYTPQMLAWGFAHMFAHWQDAELRVFAAQEIPGFDMRNLPVLLDADADLQQRSQIVPEPVTKKVLIVSASTVPSAVFQDVVLSLLAPVEVGLRPAQNLVPLFRELQAFIQLKTPKLAERLTIHETGHDERALSELLGQYDLIVVSGSDATIAHYRAIADATEPDCRPRIVAHGHKFSAIAIPADDFAALTDKDLSAIAVDASVWDQTGCLSPKCVFVEATPDASLAFAQKLAQKLDETAITLPAVPMDIAASAARNNGLRMAQFDGAQIIQSPNNGDRIVVFPPDTAFRPLLYPRTLSVYPVSDAIKSAMQLAPHGQALGMREIPDDDVQKRLAPAGYNYFSRFGTMQDPPLSWFHDNIGTMRPFFA